MNKLLTIIFLILFSSLGFAQIVSIPNSNFRNALLNSNCVDIDGDGQGDVPADFNNDGQIQVSEAEAVIGLVVEDLNISSLQGIQSFTNLEFLYCSDNPLTTIDLSQNTQLVSLYCFRTPLSQIDISNCPNLEEYRVFSNNISAVNLSQNPNLKWIDLSDNHLSTLDISNNLALINLDCPGNNLTSLNLSANINLESIWCSGNPLTNLDTSNNINLKSLACALTPIQNFDISENVNLETISVFSSGLTSLDVTHNPVLASIDIFENNIETIDLSQNPLLIAFMGDLNQFTDISFQDNPMMDWISISYNNVEELHLSHLSVIRYINAYSNNLQTVDVKNGNNTFLEYLNVENNSTLSCIEVDDVAYANSHFNWHKDPTAIYSENCILGISEAASQPSFAVYPIPVIDSFFVETNSMARITIKISSIMGVELLSKEIEKNSPINITNFQAGVYIVNMEQENHHLTQRIIKL